MAYLYGVRIYFRNAESVFNLSLLNYFGIGTDNKECCVQGNPFTFVSGGI